MRNPSVLARGKWGPQLGGTGDLNGHHGLPWSQEGQAGLDARSAQRQWGMAGSAPSAQPESEAHGHPLALSAIQRSLRERSALLLGFREGRSKLWGEEGSEC